MNAIYALVSVIIVSFISLIFLMPFLLKKKISNKALLFLLSISVGVLLSTVFMDFLPEIVSHKYTLGLAFAILMGYMVMFILETFIHLHHNKKCENDDSGHGHGYNLAPITLIGDGIHNFIDGLIIAGSYAIDITLGITATISILFHEIPQEIADFGVLLYSGMSKKKAIIFNCISATTAIFGTLVGIFLTKNLQVFIEFIIPFAAGTFIYIAASNLVPQLHKECELKDIILHVFAILIGIAIITLITLYGPAHGNP